MLSENPVLVSLVPNVHTFAKASDEIQTIEISTQEPFTIGK